MIPNRHPCDELADVRTKIRELETREATLRQELLQAGPQGLSGDEWQGYVKVSSREDFDLEAAKRCLGQAVLRPYLRRREIKSLRLAPRGQP